MVDSTVYPPALELDIISNGVARILCHWDITTTLMDDTVIYQYQEAVVNWSLPETYLSGETTVTISSREDVETYIQANANEIMSFAKASKLTM